MSTHVFTLFLLIVSLQIDTEKSTMCYSQKDLIEIGQQGHTPVPEIISENVKRLGIHKRPISFTHRGTRRNFNNHILPKISKAKVPVHISNSRRKCSNKKRN